MGREATKADAGLHAGGSTFRELAEDFFWPISPALFISGQNTAMNNDQLYQERLARYVTAMRNEKPDRIPMRPFVAEFTAKYAA